MIEIKVWVKGHNEKTKPSLSTISQSVTCVIILVSSYWCQNSTFFQSCHLKNHRHRWAKYYIKLSVGRKESCPADVWGGIKLFVNLLTTICLIECMKKTYWIPVLSCSVFKNPNNGSSERQTLHIKQNDPGVLLASLQKTQVPAHQSLGRTKLNPFQSLEGGLGGVWHSSFWHGYSFLWLRVDVYPIELSMRRDTSCAVWCVVSPGYNFLTEALFPPCPKLLVFKPLLASYCSRSSIVITFPPGRWGRGRGNE